MPIRITVEIPPAEKPEKAWLAGSSLIIDYHEWMEDVFNYVDKTKRIPTDEIVGVEMVYGPNGGFREQRLIHNYHTHEVLRLSKNHEEVVVSIYRIVKSLNLPITKVKLKRKGGE